MEKADKVTKTISLLLFIAMICYIGVYVLQSLVNPTQTVAAITITVRDCIPLTGIVIRDELVVTNSAAYIDVVAQEGKRVSKGDAIAISYQSETALERATKIRELELEIARVETLLSGLSTAQDLTTRDTAVRSAVLALSAAVSRGDLSELDSKSLSLRSLVFENSGSTATYEELGALKSQLNEMYIGSSSDTSRITAVESGVYSGILDGYEYLTAAGLDSVSPSRVHELMQSKQELPSNAIGKLVLSATWYYVAVADSNDVWLEDGSSRIKFGSNATLEFNRYYNTNISVRVDSVSRDADGECVIVFACNEALADTLAMRQATSEVIYSEHTGIRVPREALYSDTDDEGNPVSFVYTLTATQAERKNVEIIYEAEDFCLVSPASGENSLREGNEIIVGAKDIENGKVMG